MLLALAYIYLKIESLDFMDVLNWNCSEQEEILIWLAFFLAFATKVPMFPFHIWLPEAHVEAPTVGSVMLAGVILKLGIYGFLTYNMVLFPKGTAAFYPILCTLCIFGVISASMSALRQVDIKRIIAYSSIAHMNFTFLGLFNYSGNILPIIGAVFQSISHGLVSAGLFFLIGMLYKRYHSRLIEYYGGLVHTMPNFCSFLFLFILANIGMPGTSNFVGELLLGCGIYSESRLAAILCTSGVVLSAAYSLWLYN